MSKTVKKIENNLSNNVTKTVEELSAELARAKAAEVAKALKAKQDKDKENVKEREAILSAVKSAGYNNIEEMYKRHKFVNRKSRAGIGGRKKIDPSKRMAVEIDLKAGLLTVQQIAATHGVSQPTINGWKKDLGLVKSRSTTVVAA